jgi:hypothetical protein
MTLVTTHERELTAPVDLSLPDSTKVNPDALGWSRVPRHRANLHGLFGRNKRWDYWAVLAGDLVVSWVYADIDHLGLADVWWCHVPSGATGGTAIITDAADVELPERPGTAPLTVEQQGFALTVTDDDEGTHAEATWTESDGRAGSLAITVALPSGHESLNVVIPWDDETFNFTSKHQARPAVGHLEVGDEHWQIGGAGQAGAGRDDEAWGVLDVGRGRWPHRLSWNWGGGAGRVGEHVVGLQFGAKWTEGSGFTENGIIIDGRLSKIGRELTWDYDWDEPMGPWHITDPDGQLDVVLHPTYDKHSKTDAGEDLNSETHQVFGTFSGWVRTDDGLELTFDGLQGFAEEARQVW